MYKKTFIFLFSILLFLFYSCDGDIPLVETEHLPNYYTISYDSVLCENPESKEVLEGYIITDDDLPELELNRYEFLGWYYENNIQAKAGDEVNENLQLSASWKEISKVKYTINEYYENIEDDEYTLKEQSFRYDYPDEYTDVFKSTYYGFITKDFQQEKIKADGSTEINIYYERKRYTLSFDTNGGTPIDPVTVKYEQVIKMDDYATENPGYYLHHWSPKINSTITEDTTCVATWFINIVKYTQNTYFENLDNDEFTLKYTREIEGRADDLVNPYAPDDYVGYNLIPFESKIIAADSSTVIDIYYKRKICTANFYDNKGNLIFTATGKYEQALPEVTVDEIDHYTFDGWMGQYKTKSEGIFRQETEDYTPIYIPYE